MSHVTQSDLCIERGHGCFVFRHLFVFPIVQGFGTRMYNVYLTGDEERVHDREKFCSELGINLDDLVCMEQIHNNNIVRIGAEHKGRGSRSDSDRITNVDGMVTQAKGVPLAVRTADCAPLLFYDPVHEAIGVAHVGWKGAAVDLAGKMVAALKNNFLSQAEDIFVAMGPMIRPCCYEVGEDFHEMFGSHVERRGDSHYLNLAGVIMEELGRAGVRKDRIYDSGLCTACNKDLFFSYRREGSQTGRIFAVIMLKGDKT